MTQIHTLTKIDRRIESESMNCLYTQPSWLLRRDDRTNLYVDEHCEGLFSRLSYTKDNIIAVFRGKLITNSSNFAVRQDGDKRKYLHKFHSTLYLDCYDNYVNKSCLASFARSSLFVRYRNNPSARVFGNCYVKICVRTRAVRLYCRLNYVSPNTELIYTHDTAEVVAST